MLKGKKFDAFALGSLLSTISPNLDLQKYN